MSSQTDELPPDVNRGPEVLASCGSLVAITLVLVILRSYVRVRVVRSFGLDDWAMVGAMVILFVEFMFIIPQVQLGGGRHVQYIIPAENVTKGLHLNFVTQPLCLIALLLTKISVGFFLLRFTPSPRYKWVIIGVMIFTVLSATGNIFTVFFQCRPLPKTWDGSVDGECLPPANLKFAAFFNSAVSVFTDLLFAVLPVPMLWKVQLNWKTKAAVTAVLSLGIFATIAAIVKITFLGNYGKHGDFLFDSVDITIWTTVEIATAMVAACIPTLKPLFKALLRGSSAGASKYGSSAKTGYALKNESFHNRSRKSRAVDGDYEMFDTPSSNSEVKGGMRSKVGKMDSEESILTPEDRITKTTQVTISVDEYGQRRKNPRDMV
ncbi:integral membrane protein [Thozetella sp. PMI_491]|nr:integral membrane protein [Thozetella sp. PMI_491]